MLPLILKLVQVILRHLGQTLFLGANSAVQLKEVYLNKKTSPHRAWLLESLMKALLMLLEITYELSVSQALSHALQDPGLGWDLTLDLGLSLKLHTMIYLILNNIYINSKFQKALFRLNFGLHLFNGVRYWPYSLLHINTLTVKEVFPSD